MRGTTGLSRGKYILKQINLIRQSMGMYTTSIQKKGNNEITKEGPVTGNIHEPILAFNKPQLPPGLGPIIIFSLLETRPDWEENDNEK